MLRALFCFLVISVVSVVDAADFSGVVVGVDGLTRSEAKICPSGGVIWKGQTSDRQGCFIIKNIENKDKVWIAHSQHSKAMGIFTIPENYKEQTFKVVLNCREGKVEGRVVDKDGKGVKGKKIELVIETASGEICFFNGYRNTDKNGLYEAAMPFGEGIKVYARIAGKNEEESKYVSKTIALSYDQILKDLPTIIIGGGNPVESDDGRVQYSGRILNEDKQPIAGVEVDVMFKMPGYMSTWSKEVMTNKDGRWTMRVPDAGSNFRVRLDHPEYQGFHYERMINPSLEELKNGTSILVMKRGIRIKGKVFDQQGKPVKNAIVTAGRLYSSSGGKIIEDCTTDRTSTDGTFSIGGLPKKQQELNAYAEGFAPSRTKIEITNDTKPYSITLKKGWTYKGRLIDQAGKPVKGMKVYTSNWMIGQERKRIDRNDISDSDGRFSIDGLPTEGSISFTYGRSRTRYLCFSKEVTSKDSMPDEVIIPYNVQISGKVVDAKTGEPIEKFTLTNGIKGKGFGEGYSWSRHYKYNVKSEDGTFKKQWDGFHIDFPFESSCHMRITAKGYLPEITPPVEIGKNYEPFIIRMTKGKTWTGKVTDSEGNPAENIQIGWVGKDEKAFIKNGKFDSTPYVKQSKVIIKTKADGAFTIPPSRSNGLLVAVHPEKGYAVVKSEDFENGSSIKLTRWAKIKGINSDSSDSQFKVCISIPDSEDTSGQKICWKFDEISFSKQSFTIDHLPSTPLMIGKVIRLEISNHINIKPEPGKTHKIKFSSDGCTVTGKIVLPWLIDGKPASKDIFGDPRQLHAAAFIVDPKEKILPALEGKKSDDFLHLYRDIENVYKPSQTLQKRFMPIINEDGTFRLNNLKCGKYDIVINLYLPLDDEQTCGRGFREVAKTVSFIVGKNDKEIKIPEIKLISAFK